MYHSLKSGKKQRKNRRLLGACFVLAGLWAAALGLLLLREASAAGAEEAPSVTLLYRGSRWLLPADGRTAGELLAGLGLWMLLNIPLLLRSGQTRGRREMPKAPPAAAEAETE